MISLVLMLISTNLFAQEHYSMIINGGGDASSNHLRYAKNNENFFKAINKCGVKRENIVLLNADGLSKEKDMTITGTKMMNSNNVGKLFKGSKTEDLTMNSPQSMLGDSKTDVDGAATKENIETEATKLQRKMKPGDNLTVYVNDHGTLITEESYDYNTGKKSYKKVPGIVLWGQSMSVPEFKRIMKKFSDKGVKTQIVSSACYSGGLLELTDKNTCVFTTTTADKVTHSNTYNNEYMDAFSEKLGECKPMSTAHAYGKTLDSNDNEPQTSMDWYFHKYLKNKFEKPKDVSHCVTPANDGFEKINTLSVASSTFVAPRKDEKMMAFDKMMLDKDQEEKEAQKMIPKRIEELKTEKKKILEAINSGKPTFYDKADVKNIDKKIAVLSDKKVSTLTAKDKMNFSKADSYDMKMHEGIASCMKHTPGKND